MLAFVAHYHVGSWRKNHEDFPLQSNREKRTMKSFPYNRKFVSTSIPFRILSCNDFSVQATVKALYTGQRMFEMSNRKRRSEGRIERIPSIPTTCKILFSKLQMTDNGEAWASAPSLSKRDGIPSTPVALINFNSLRAFQTSDSAVQQRFVVKNSSSVLKLRQPLKWLPVWSVGRP